MKFNWRAIFSELLCVVGLVVLVVATNKHVNYGLVDLDKTVIVCNYGNNKTLSAKEANIKFAITDFFRSYLPNTKRIELQNACEITYDFTIKQLELLISGEDTTALFDVSPVFKWSILNRLPLPGK